jgi:hypothetical protein
VVIAALLLWQQLLQRVWGMNFVLEETWAMGDASTGRIEMNT